MKNIQCMLGFLICGLLMLSCASAPPQATAQAQPAPATEPVGPPAASKAEAPATPEPVDSPAPVTAAPAQSAPAVDFDALTAAINQAKIARADIIKNNIVEPDSPQTPRFADADKALSSASDVAVRGPAATTADEQRNAEKGAKAALDTYQALSREYWSNQSAIARQQAISQRSEALNVKADAVAKDDFAAAEVALSRADEAATTGDFKASAVAYHNAEIGYQKANKTASDKRYAATIAVQNATNKVKESQRIAVNADAIIGGAL